MRLLIHNNSPVGFPLLGIKVGIAQTVVIDSSAFKRHKHPANPEVPSLQTLRIASVAPYRRYIRSGFEQ